MEGTGGPQKSEISHLSKELADQYRGRKVLCLIDGQHYPPVTRAAADEISGSGGEVVGLVFIGGTEKVENAREELGGERGYRLFHEDDDSSDAIPRALIIDAVRETGADIVVDLSDEPVVDYFDRFSIGSKLLMERVSYMGADFYFSPPTEYDVLKKPSLAITGTGKRVGKTAVGVFISRLLKREDMDPVVVCMGRGGPPEPEIVDPTKMTLGPDMLLEVARRGGHAASDYWEDAVLGNVVTVGCRRCGGGMAGNPFLSNVIEGAGLTNDLPQSFVIMEGSGATLPPVRTEGGIVIIGAAQPTHNILDLYGEYRIAKSDMALVTMCEGPFADEKKVDAIHRGISDIKKDIPIALTVFRPEPLGDIRGKKVYIATTAKDWINEGLRSILSSEHDAEVVGISNNLSNRKKLRQDLSMGLRGAEVLLTEIKAASIDVAAHQAKEHGLDIAFLNNRPHLIGGNVEDLEESILSICRSMIERKEG